MNEYMLYIISHFYIHLPDIKIFANFVYTK